MDLNPQYSSPQALYNDNTTLPQPPVSYLQPSRLSADYLKHTQGLTVNPSNNQTVHLTSNGSISKEEAPPNMTLDSQEIAVAGNKHRIAPENHPVVGAGSGPQPNNSGPILRYFDYNLYAVKKSVSSALLDVALLMANASQLKQVMLNHDHPYYIAMITLLSASIVLQICVGVALIVLGKMNINDPNERVTRNADKINTVVLVGVFLLTVINIFISAFGLGNNQIVAVTVKDTAAK